MNLHQFRQYLFNNLPFGEARPSERRAEHLFGRNFEERALILSLVMPNQARVWGIDASHWNLPPLNLKRMADIYGMKFAIFKGCDGSLNSKYYFEHVAAAKLAGIPWGMYVWLYPNSKVSIDAQVATWDARAKADPPPMGIFIDAEWTSYAGAPANPSAADLRAAHDKIKARYGKPATTYTAAGYANTYLKGFDWTREDLWIANYGVNNPALPTGASKYVLWQFTSTLDGKILDPNGNAELDGNYFNGTLAEFEKKYLVTTPPPPIPEGKDMIFINLVTVAGLNGRDGPNADAAIIWQGGLKLNDVVIADEKSGAWFKVRAVVRAGASVALPAVPAVWASMGGTGTLQKQLASFENVPDLGELVINADVPVSMTLTAGAESATYGGAAVITLTKQA